MSAFASLRQFIKPTPPSDAEALAMPWPQELWFLIRSGPTGLFWPLGMVVFSLSLWPLHPANLIFGVIMATVGTGAYAGIARSIRLLRGTVGLEVFGGSLRLQAETPRRARFMVRAFFPLSVMLASAWLLVLMVVVGITPNANVSDPPPVGILDWVVIVLSVACIAAFVLATPFLLTMGFFGRPRFLMPKDYRDRGEAKLRLLAEQPDVWTAEDYASPDIDLTPEELAAFKLRQERAEQRYAQKLRAFEAGLPSGDD